MTRLPILSNEPDAVCLPDNLLPTFYMEDHSVLGLRVGNINAALRLLEDNGISSFRKPDYSELSIDHRDQIPVIVKLLNSNNISCTITDIVEQAYQG